MSKSRIFYGWFIVIGGFFIMATCYTIFVNCTSLFLVPITTDLNITRTQFSLCSSISAVVAIFASLAVGKLLDKFNARIIGSISVGVIVLDILAWAFVTKLWQLYVLSIIAGFFVLAGTRLLMSILISNWFNEKRGLAISLTLMGSGVGGVILSPIVSKIISVNGWRTAYVVLAIITFIFSMPLTVFAFRNKPSEMGLKPYGSEQQNEIKEKLNEEHGVGWKVLKKSLAFWSLVLGFVFMGMVNGGVIINTVAQLTDAGHTEAFAAMILSINMFVVIIGKMSLGVIYDKFGLISGTIFGSVTTVLSTIMLLFSHSTAGPILYAILFGFGTCLGTVAPPLMVVSEFGRKDMGTVTGVVTAFEMLGTAISAPLIGSIYDKYGTYAPGWVILTVIGVLMMITLCFSVILSKKLSINLNTEEQKISTVASNL